MSRLLVAAAAIVAGIVIPAAAALALPHSAASSAGITVPTVTVPTVSVPTVTVPSVPVPTVPTPTVPTPTVTLPTPPTPTVSTPRLPAPTPTVGTSTVPTATVGGHGSPSSSSGSAPAGSGGTGSPGVAHAGRPGSQRNGSRSRLQQPRITRFHAAHAGVVRVAAWELAPRCRFVGMFALRVRRGGNLLRVPQRIGAHRLHAGSYHLVGVARGVEVLDVRFRLVHARQHLRVRRRHVADVCSAALPFTQTMLAALPLGPAGSAPPSLPTSSPKADGTAPIPGAAPPFLPPVLRDLNPANASPLAREIFFALLGCAIVLLGAATLPEGAAVGGAGGVFVARHRATITVGGLALLLLAALLLLVL